MYHQQQQRQTSNILMNLINNMDKSLLIGKKSLINQNNNNNDNDSTGLIINLNDLNKSNAAFIGTICIAIGFILLTIFATIYYYRKRSLYNNDGKTGTQNNNNNNNKILLLKKDLTFNNEKPYQLAQNKKTPAVRSPNSNPTSSSSSSSSSSTNPFQKKSPSPTGCLSPANDEQKRNIDVESGRSNNNNNNNNNSQNNSKNCSPINEEPIISIINKKQSIDYTKAELNNNQNQNQNNQNQNQQIEQQQQQQKNLGKLHFKLKYSYEKRALCLTINRCVDLPLLMKNKEQQQQHQQQNNGQLLDPYVKIQLLPEKQHKAKTRVIKKSQNPIYNEEFTFYGITSTMLENLSIHFLILNFDRFSKDEIIGEILCRLNQFEFDSLEKQLIQCNDIVPIGNKLKIQDLGELLLSLCYQPIANRLTVVILKARNLPKMDLTGLCDPYVKIYVFHNNERISKKRTHIKKRTLSPVFNESFIFDIPVDESLDNIRLQFLIYDHDRVTRNELIGKIEIGSKTGQQSTEKHWHEVIKSPRRQIAEWHKLQEISTSSTNTTTTN